MHLTRAQSDAVWASVYVPTGADFVKIDQNLTDAINADGGGTYAPTAAIVLGGAGLVAAGLCVIGNGSIVLTSGGTSRIVFDSDAIVQGFELPVGHPLRTRARADALYEFYCDGQSSIRLSTSQTTFNADFVDGSHSMLVPLDVDDGSTITSVDIRHLLADGGVHAQIRVIRVSSDGRIDPLAVPDTTTDALGFRVTPTPATNAVQTFSYACNQNDVVDRSAYAYFVEILDPAAFSVSTGVATQDEYYSVTSHVTVAVLDGRA